MWKVIVAVCSVLSAGIYAYVQWQGRKQRDAELDRENAEQANKDRDIASKPYVDDPIDSLYEDDK